MGQLSKEEAENCQDRYLRVPLLLGEDLNNFCHMCFEGHHERCVGDASYEGCFNAFKCDCARAVFSRST